MTTEMMTGDWRSGAYGADRKAHLFTYEGATKVAACGVRVDVRKYSRPSANRKPAYACRDCQLAAERWA